MEKLLTQEEVADILGIDTQTVKRIREDENEGQRLPAIRVGRLWRFKPSDVQAYIDRNATAQPA